MNDDSFAIDWTVLQSQPRWYYDNFLSIVTLQMLVQVTICKTIVQIIMQEKNYLQFEMAKENESKNEKVREITISVNGDELSKMFSNS